MPLYTIPGSIVVDLRAMRKAVIGDTTASTAGFYGTTPRLIGDASDVTDVDSLVDELQALGLLSATS